ncbi:MAG: RelA/SpoT family protein [Bacteroidota bacterium]|nr:RelA/SpoT family protein [Bacteroidota bacterium]
MSIISQHDNQLIKEQFDELLNNLQRVTTRNNKDQIRKAFKVANEAHKHMKRRSGEPYVLHPIAVARIVSEEMGLGTISICASLLHDVVEDTDYTLENIESNFGEKISTIIDGLTKISEVFDKKSSLQAENFRKMLLTLSDDVRVILIKLADRLHNMRTLGSMPPNKRLKIAGETIYLYAPLAHRLGLYAIKTELEDLSLKYRHNKVYRQIGKQIKVNEKKRINEITKFSLPIISRLDSTKLNYEINGRPKSIYSIWNKMQTQKISFEEVYDLLAIRIVFDPVEGIPEKTQCWNIYSIITDIYLPKPDRLRDWVSKPKANGYEALHCTVMGPYGKWAEIQIRSKRMDEIAEKGLAAHWKYKKNGTGEDSELDKWIKKIRELIDDSASNALEFLDEFKLNLFSAEILVFTPKGHIKSLPKNATVLDFAYDIHTEIGDKAIGAKVNHKLVPFSHVLKSSDQVEIISSEKSKPQQEWLKYVTTAKAKSSITKSLKAETTNRIELGKDILEKELKKHNVQPSGRVFKKLLPAYEVISKDQLYSNIGSGIINLDGLKKILRKKSSSKWIWYWRPQFGKQKTIEQEKKESKKFNFKQPFIIREDPDKSEAKYTISSCCSPIPGDDVVGYQDENGSIIIHKSNCNEAVKLMSHHGNRIVSAKWTTHKVLSYLARINLVGIDKIGMIRNITEIISQQLSVNIRSLNVEVHDGIFEGIVDLYVHNTADLNNLILNLSKLKGVDSVKREEIVGT